MKFQDYSFSKPVLRNIELLGFQRPTDIQYKAIPNIMKGEDLLAVAQTGTGKTAAFAIPLVDMIFKRKKKLGYAKGISCIVLEPTHELAQQITQTINDIAKNTSVKTLGVYGGVEQQPQIDKLKAGIDIMVATPGRMFDLISQGWIDTRYVHYLVIDEADHMLDLGFIKDVLDLNRKLSKKQQTLFFSATIDKKIKDIAYDLVKQNAIRIQISPKNPVANTIDHRVAFIEMDDKRFFLERLINEHEESKMIVFVRTRVRAERVSKAMTRVNIETVTIHGEKDQKERSTILEEFRNGYPQILIATDVTARGIDIPNVDIVVNYDLPEQPDNYVHRVGRTGRGGLRGEALSFCSSEETELLEEIENYTGSEIERIQITKEDLSNTRLLTHDQNIELKEMMRELEELEKLQRKKKGGN